MQLANALVSGSIQFRMQVSGTFKFSFYSHVRHCYQIFSLSILTGDSEKFWGVHVIVKSKSDWSAEVP